MAGGGRPPARYIPTTKDKGLVMETFREKLSIRFSVNSAPLIGRACKGGLLLGALLLAACGGDDSPGPPKLGTTEQPVGAIDPSANPANSDQQPITSVNDPAITEAPLDSLASTQARNLAPAVAGADLQARVAGNNAFAGSFYRAAAALPESIGGNLVYSPYSLISALAMTYAGAAGTTATQMATALQINQPADTFHASSNQLDLELTSRDVKAGDAALQVTNGLFLQRGAAVQPAFVDTLGINYGAPVYWMDNLSSASAETTRAQINAWVSERTNNKIVDLLAPGATFLAKFVLTNAVLFKGTWVLPFDSNVTAPQVFSLLSGATANVPMMRNDISVQVAAGDGYTTVSLPYVGNAFEMVLVLPDAGRFAAVESRAPLSRPAELLAGATQRYVRLSVPRFDFKTKLDANALLSQLGMVNAFIPDVADFSAIDGTRELLIKQVVHSAAISLDENGTEAAAATAVVGAPSLPSESIAFDRPFLFLITDKETGSVIFMGRVLDPSQS